MAGHRAGTATSTSTGTGTTSEERIRRTFPSDGPVKAIHFPAGPADVPDQASLRLVVFHHYDVVGPAQPVLNQVERAIETVAMTAPSQARQQQVATRVAEIRSQIEEAKAEAITLDDLESVPEPSEGVGPAITLEGLEQVLTAATATAQRFHPHPTIPGAYLLEASGRKVAVTLRRAILDEYAPDVSLLTYGTQELTDLLAEVGVETPPLDQARFMLDGQTIRTLDELNRAVAAEVDERSRMSRGGRDGPSADLP